jgi:hypothetical protein
MKTASALCQPRLALGFSAVGTAADLAAPEGKTHETIWNRETLTGDWGGFRRTLDGH